MEKLRKTNSKEQCYYISVPNNSNFKDKDYKECLDEENYNECLSVQGKGNESSQLEGDISDKMCNNDAKSEKKTLFHITMQYAGYFSHLEVNKLENVNLNKQESYKEYLYFEKKKEAKMLLRDIKQCIFNFYKLRKEVKGILCPVWVNEYWVKSANWKEYEKKLKKEKGSRKTRKTT